MKAGALRRIGSLRSWERAALAVMLVVALGGEGIAAQSPYLLVKLSKTPTYSSAYGQVNKQLNVLQARRTGATRRAKCRNEYAIQWLADQSHETASWPAGAADQDRNAKLVAKLRGELAAQSKLQPCARRALRGKT